jgi:nitrite reductase (NO-forming)
VPVVLGGGPNILRGTQARMDRGNVLRVVLINAGLLVAVLPVPGQVTLLTAALVLGAFAAFLPLLILAVLYAVRAKHAGQDSIDRAALPRHVPEPAAVTRRRNTGQAALALALVILAVAVGYALAR